MSRILWPVVRSEWTKFRTRPGTTLLMLGTVLLTTALGAAAVAALAGTSLIRDPVRLSLSGLDLGQALVVVMAVRSAAGEWETGMALTTYGATPWRPLVLVSKAIVIGAAVGISALPAVAGSVLAGHLMLTWTAAPPAAIAAAPVIVRAILGTVLYMVLVALLGLVVGTVVRDRTMALGVSLGLLYLFPVGAQMVADPRWQTLLKQLGPMPAGMAIEATTHLAVLPIAPWAGIAVLGGWSVGALMAGWVVAERRDV